MIFWAMIFVIHTSPGYIAGFKFDTKKACEVGIMKAKIAIKDMNVKVSFKCIEMGKE